MSRTRSSYLPVTSPSINAVAGVLGPIAFALSTIIFAAMRPEYDHMTQFISELGATGTPNAEGFNVFGFGLAGALITVFCFTLFRLLPASILARVGAALVTVFGVGMLIVGIYSCDPGCIVISQEGRIHDGVSAFMFTSVILGIFLVSLALRRQDGWRRHAIYSLITAIALVVLLVIMLRSAETRTLSGMWQRLFLATLFTWIAATGIKLYKINLNKT